MLLTLFSGGLLTSRRLSFLAGLGIEECPGEFWRPLGLGPSTRTDANGYYRLSGLPPERVAISLVCQGPDRIRSKFAELMSDETTVLDFIDDGESETHGRER